MSVEDLVARYGFDFQNLTAGILRGEHLGRPPLNQNECIRDAEAYARSLTDESRRRLEQGVLNLACHAKEPLLRRGAWALCGRLKILSSLPTLRQEFVRSTTGRDYAGRGALLLALADIGDADRIPRALEEIRKDSPNSLEGFLVLLEYAPKEFRRALRQTPKVARRGILSTLRFMRGLRLDPPEKAHL